MKQKVFFITPVFNSAPYIEETILSVINQSMVQKDLVDLEYWIIDGGSNDGTLEIIKRYLHLPFLKLISEPDKGMYDALTKGLIKISDDRVCGYINSGDILSYKCFEIIIDIFQNYPKIKWLTGINVFYNDKSQIVNMNTPFRYRSKMFQEGFYGSFLPCVQQESTFWNSSLLTGIDFEKLRSLKLAGDSYLWNHFSSKTNLYIIQAYLSGFRVHEGQLSENNFLYKKELSSFSKPKSAIHFIFALIDLLIWLFPNKIKRLLNNDIITYNFKNKKWEL